MDNTDIYVTKKELYVVASNICVLILFTVLLGNQEGFERLYVCVWALGLQLYCVYKLHKAKNTSSMIDLKKE